LRANLRGCSPPALRVPAHWRSLFRNVPTSDALCHLAGTPRWLQATVALPSHTPCDTCTGLTRSAKTASRPPRKGRTSNDQDAFYRIEKPLRNFRHATTQTLRVIWEDSARCLRTRSPSCPPPPVSVLRANPPYVATIFFRLGRDGRDSPCDAPRVTIRDASDRFLPPNTLVNENPYSPAPGFISPSDLPSFTLDTPGVYPTGCAHQDRGYRAFHDARIASADRPASWGLFVPSLSHLWGSPLLGDHEGHAFDCGGQPLTPLSPPELTSCCFPRCSVARDGRAARPLPFRKP
jgi:hypothetical protein